MKITFETKIWLWQGGKASWFFVSLPCEDAAKLKLHNAFDLKGLVRLELRLKLVILGGKLQFFPIPKKKHIFCQLRQRLEEVRILQKMMWLRLR